MKQIEIPHQFIALYLGGITSWYRDDHDFALPQDEKIPSKYLNEELVAANNHQEGSILLTIISFLAMNPSISLVQYDDSGYSWSEMEMLNLVEQLYHFHKEKCKILQENLALPVVLSDSPLNQWRETIKPQILAQFKELGIEP